MIKRGGRFLQRSNGSLDLSSNLVLSLDLEEVSGDAIDQSISEYDFIDVNTVESAAGATPGYGSRLFTPDNSEHLYLPSSGTSNVNILDNEWAMHFWAKRNATGARIIFAKSPSTVVATATARAFIIYFSLSTLIFTVGRSVAADGAVSVSANVPMSEWIPVLCWHDPNADVIGVKIGTDAAVTTTLVGGARAGSSSDVRIGSTSVTPGSYLDANLAALRIWRGAGVINQIVNPEVINFLNARQRRHTELV